MLSRLRGCQESNVRIPKKAGKLKVFKAEELFLPDRPCFLIFSRCKLYRVSV